MTTTIYHYPRCSTSRTVLETLRQAGIEPDIIEYLKTPPDHAALRALLTRLRLPARAILREKEALFAELGLADPALSDEDLIDRIVQHPILLQRPIVCTDKGAAVCRPADKVQELL